MSVASTPLPLDVIAIVPEFTDAIAKRVGKLLRNIGKADAAGAGIVDQADHVVLLAHGGGIIAATAGTSHEPGHARQPESVWPMRWRQRQRERSRFSRLGPL